MGANGALWPTPDEFTAFRVASNQITSLLTAVERLHFYTKYASDERLSQAAAERAWVVRCRLSTEIRPLCRVIEDWESVVAAADQASRSAEIVSEDQTDSDPFFGKPENWIQPTWHGLASTVLYMIDATSPSNRDLVDDDYGLEFISSACEFLEAVGKWSVLTYERLESEVFRELSKTSVACGVPPFLLRLKDENISPPMSDYQSPSDWQGAMDKAGLRCSETSWRRFRDDYGGEPHPRSGKALYRFPLAKLASIGVEPP